MSTQFLDVSTMPFEQTYVCKDGNKVALHNELLKHHGAIDAMAANDLLKTNGSYGFAMLEPLTEPADSWADDLWDHPEQYVWFVGGWGPQRERYIANAVRKLRPALRVALSSTYEAPLSTLDMRIEGDTEWFEDCVDSQDPNGNFEWGDFPWGGATALTYGEEFALIGAVSGFTEIEDDTVAKLILGGIAKPIILGLGTNVG